MLQACPAGQSSLHAGVVGEFEAQLSEKLNKNSASLSDLEEMKKKLEAVVT